MAVIRIVPDALRAAAERHQMIQEAISEATAELHNLENRLDAAWDGGASRAALNHLENIIGGLGEVSFHSSSSSDFLKNTAQAFESFDEGSVGVLISSHYEYHPIVGPGGVNPLYLFQGYMRIEPDEVRSVASGCCEVADNLRENAHEIRKQAQNLSADWEGNAYNRFFDRSMRISEGFESVADSLDYFSQETISSANRYEELDNTFAAD